MEINKVYCKDNLEVLKSLPDGYTEGICEGDRCKALGNGWTVDVVAHIFKGLR